MEKIVCIIVIVNYFNVTFNSYSSCGSLNFTSLKFPKVISLTLKSLVCVQGGNKVHHFRQFLVRFKVQAVLIMERP